MDEQGIVALKAFVPAKDYDLSTKFYQDLGFSVVWESPEVKEMKVGSYSFLLQNYYQEDWANNFMLHLMVEDLDAWWHHISEEKLSERYQGVKAKAPNEYPWGLREIHLIDPTGICWHIGEFKK